MSLTVSLDSSNLAAKLARAKVAAESGLKAGVAAAAQMFEEEEQSTVPVLSGNLRDHIHTETVTDTPAVQTLMVTPIEEAANKYGFEPPYARRIELGFIGTDSLGRHYHQAAEPFVQPAFDNKQDEARAAIVDGIQAELSGVA